MSDPTSEPSAPDGGLARAVDAGLAAARKDLRKVLTLGEVAPDFPEGMARILPRGHNRRANRARHQEVLHKILEGVRSKYRVPKEERTGLFRALLAPDSLSPASYSPTPRKQGMSPQEWVRQAEASMEEWHPHRIVVAWRFAREHGRLHGRLGLRDPIGPALLPARTRTGMEDPWASGWQGVLGPQDDPMHPAPHHQTLPGTWAEDGAGEYLALPVAPPQVPEDWLLAPEALDLYDPSEQEDDPLLHRWLEFFAVTVRSLGIEDGSQDDPDLGKKGLHGMLDPVYCRIAFPSRAEVVAFEEFIVGRTLEVLVEGEDPMGSRVDRSMIGTSGAMEFLSRKYGLLPREARTVIDLARDRAKSVADGDLAQNRAMMVLRLEAFISRLRQINPMDGRNELAALKQLAIVQGLAKAEQDNDLADMLRGFDAVASPDEDDPDALPPPTPAQVT